MKYLLALVATMLVILLPVSARATDLFSDACTGDAATHAAACLEKRNTNPAAGPNGVLLQVVHIIAIIAGAAAVIVIIIGAIKFVTSSGDSGSVSSAKQTILYALVGLVVIVVGQSLISYIISKL